MHVFKIYKIFTFARRNGALAEFFYLWEGFTSGKIGVEILVVGIDGLNTFSLSFAHGNM